jgi:heme exporter protein B
MSGAVSTFARELRIAWSGGGGPALPVGFFAAASSLTPFAVGPDSETLRIAGPGVTWIALALASLLPMERLFQADLEDGTLDAYAGSGVAMEGIAAAKTLAHWFATGIPLAVIAPIIWIMLLGPPEVSGLVVAVSAIGSAGFFFIGSIGAALAAGVRRGGLLIALVALPLYTPLMIFGAATLNLAAEGGNWGPPLMLTGAVTLLAAVISPIASALALRAAID